MGLIYRLTQEISDEERRAGEKQCFIGHEFRQKDLRVKLERALSSLGLQAYFADEEVTGDFILTKVCKKILVTRASIVDLTTANPNVYYELGIAIGLNKPVFVVLKRGASVPSLLESFVKLHFASYAGLERELVKQVPDWLKYSIEHHLLYNTHCHFVNALCPDRQRVTPQRRYLVIDQVESTDEAGQPILTCDPDLRAELLHALDRFHFTPLFLEDVPAQDRKYRQCDYCLALRGSSFALCHLTRRTSSNVYLVLGLATGLDISSLLIVHDERDRDNTSLFEIPRMLRGLDAFCYRHAVDISYLLADRAEVFLNRLRSRPLRGKRLPFPDLVRRFDLEPLSEPPVLVEVREILGQLVEVVTDLLGEPQSTDSSDYRSVSEYQVGKEIAQVEFYDGIAVFISCELRSLGLTEDRHALACLGLSLPATPPTIEDLRLRLKRWEPFESFGRLTIYYDDDSHSIESVTIGTREAFLATEQEIGAHRVVLDDIRNLASAEEQVEALISAVNRIAELGDTRGLRGALAIAQSITESPQQAQAMIAVVEALAEVRDIEGMRRAVEMALSIESASTRDRVLETIARTYKLLGDDEKAQQVSVLQGEVPVRIASALTDGIVRILRSDGSTAGTGFVITDTGLIATCAHVVEATGAGPGSAIRVVFYVNGQEQEAEVESDWWRPANSDDVAVLRLAKPLPHGVAPLDLGQSRDTSGHSFTTFGFSAVRDAEGMWGYGTLGSHTTEAGHPLIQLTDATEISPGFSGAPVLDVADNRVVGMATITTGTDTYGLLTETSFITPIETLQRICPVLPRAVQDRDELSARSKPATIRSVLHHFEDLSPEDFERLVYVLVKRSGEFYEVQAYGGARDKGRDVVAYKHAPAGREKWYIQCKRYEKIAFPTLRAELDKLATHARADPGFAPDVVVFAISGSVPPQAKDRAADHARELGLPEPYYWGRWELDERLKAQPQTEEEFFGRPFRSFSVPFQVPPLPAHFILRPEVTGDIKDHLLSDAPAVPGVLLISAIHGLGGTGKSVLAAALAHDLDVQQRFPDGILWATLGQQPDVLSLLTGWIQALGDHDFHPALAESASAHLRTLLHDKACLLVIDDAWQADHVRAFLVGGEWSWELITTRDVSLARRVGARLYDLDVMSQSQALALFEARLGPLGSEREQAMMLARKLSYLPLALELVVAQVDAGYSWAELLEAFGRRPFTLQAKEPQHVREQVSEALLQLRAKQGLPKQQRTVHRGLWYNSEPRQIWLNGQDITRELSADQYALLVFLSQRPGVVCTKDEVAQAAWPDQVQEGIADDQIYQLIRGVREKVEPDPLNPRYITTVRGQGYRLETFQDRGQEHQIETPQGIEQRTARGGLGYNPETRQIWLDGEDITRKLSADQYALLVFLCQWPGVVCTKDEIAQAAWPDQLLEGITDAQIYQLIKRVREKVEPDPLNPRYIVTVRGQGYLLKTSQGREQQHRLETPQVTQQRPARSGLWYSPETRRIWLDGKDITRKLSAAQYALLVFLCQRPGVMCTMDEIAQAVWPDQLLEGITDAQIYQLIKRVREKVEPDPLNPRYITSVRGRGYLLEIFLD